eukprot:TRINITY_DN2954_c0_g1_i3.p2 TRINITY_DN2954_c0_g1~~TRINITY_DN2954_c0_g1_i3.p2  ORF type:complete len:185 (+),score=39.53 TRINITY_DN2954_c0_g1_i3:852-1406(+)
MIIESDIVNLVPYKPHHVEQYNTWLTDSAIQELTGTEPVSLEEEYQSQKDWESAQDRNIFIVLDKSIPRDNQDGYAMAGDVNLFLEEGEEGEIIGELDIMIAEEQSRRKGIASRAIELMMQYAYEFKKVSKFIVKINDDNEPSLNLFRKLNFQQVDHSEVFQQTTLSLTYNTPISCQYQYKHNA